MKKVSRKTLEKKLRDGDWEMMNDLTRSGYVYIRSNVSGKSFMIEVVS